MRLFKRLLEGGSREEATHERRTVDRRHVQEDKVARSKAVQLGDLREIGIEQLVVESVKNSSTHKYTCPETRALNDDVRSTITRLVPRVTDIVDANPNPYAGNFTKLVKSYEVSRRTYKLFAPVQEGSCPPGFPLVVYAFWNCVTWSIRLGMPDWYGGTSAVSIVAPPAARLYANLTLLLYVTTARSIQLGTVDPHEVQPGYGGFPNGLPMLGCVLLVLKPVCVYLRRPKLLVRVMRCGIVANRVRTSRRRRTST